MKLNIKTGKRLPYKPRTIIPIMGVVLILLLCCSYSTFRLIQIRTSSPELTLKYPKITNKESLAIEGKAKPNQKLELFSGLDLIDETTANQEGYFTFSVITLNEDLNTFTIKTYDSKDKVENIEKAVIIFDNQPPVLKSLNRPDSPVYQQLINISGVTEADSKVFLYRDDKLIDEAKSNKNGSFEITGIRLKNGDNLFNFKIKDQAGNFNKKPIGLNLSYLTYNQDLSDICRNTFEPIFIEKDENKKKIIKINAPVNLKTTDKEDLVAEVYLRQAACNQEIGLIKNSLLDVAKLIPVLLKNKEFTYYKIHSYGSLSDKSNKEKEIYILTVEFSYKSAKKIDWEKATAQIEKDARKFLPQADYYYLNPDVFFESVHSN